MLRITAIFILLIQTTIALAQKHNAATDSLIIQGHDTLVHKYGGLIKYNPHPAGNKIKSVYIQVLHEWGTPDCCHMLVRANRKAENSANHGDERAKLPKAVVNELFGLLNYLDAGHLKYAPGYYKDNDYTKVDIVYADKTEAHLFFSEAVSPAELLLIRRMAQKIYDGARWKTKN